VFKHLGGRPFLVAAPVNQSSRCCTRIPRYLPDHEVPHRFPTRNLIQLLKGPVRAAYGYSSLESQKCRDSWATLYTAVQSCMTQSLGDNIVHLCTGLPSCPDTFGIQVKEYPYAVRTGPLTIEPNSGWETGEGPHYQVGTQVHLCSDRTCICTPGVSKIYCTRRPLYQRRL
jgi:hypothetical protein